MNLLQIILNDDKFLNCPKVSNISQIPETFSNTINMTKFNSKNFGTLKH